MVPQRLGEVGVDLGGSQARMYEQEYKIIYVCGSVMFAIPKPILEGPGLAPDTRVGLSVLAGKLGFGQPRNVLMDRDDIYLVNLNAARQRTDRPVHDLSLLFSRMSSTGWVRHWFGPLITQGGQFARERGFAVSLSGAATAT